MCLMIYITEHVIGDSRFGEMNSGRAGAMKKKKRPAQWRRQEQSEGGARRGGADKGGERREVEDKGKARGEEGSTKEHVHKNTLSAMLKRPETRNPKPETFQPETRAP